MRVVLTWSSSACLRTQLVWDPFVCMPWLDRSCFVPEEHCFPLAHTHFCTVLMSASVCLVTYASVCRLTACIIQHQPAAAITLVSHTCVQMPAFSRFESQCLWRIRACIELCIALYMMMAVSAWVLEHAHWCHGVSTAVSTVAIWKPLTCSVPLQCDT